MSGVNTVFTVPVDKILEDIKDKLFYRPPRKVEGEFFGRALHMRCNYHEADGHLTEHCHSQELFRGISSTRIPFRVCRSRRRVPGFG